MPNQRYFDGETYPSKKHGDFTIIKFKTCMDVKIQFKKTGSVISVSTRTIRSQSVVDPYTKTVYGIGYSGEYVCPDELKPHLKRIRALWKEMIRRCHDPISLRRRPNYLQCSICDEWFCFANFLRDIVKVENFDLWLGSYEYQLDKDIKIPGNKIYKPDAVKFVTKSENVREAMHRRGRK